MVRLCLELRLLPPFPEQPSGQHTNTPQHSSHGAQNCFHRLPTVQENKWAIGEKKVNWLPGNDQMDSFIKGHKDFDFQNSSDYSEGLAHFNYFRLIYLMFPRNGEMFNVGCFIAYFMFKH